MGPTFRYRKMLKFLVLYKYLGTTYLTTVVKASAMTADIVHIDIPKMGRAAKYLATCAQKPKVPGSI